MIDGSRSLKRDAFRFLGGYRIRENMDRRIKKFKTGRVGRDTSGSHVEITGRDQGMIQIIAAKAAAWTAIPLSWVPVGCCRHAWGSPTW